MGSLFRSESMTLCQLFLQSESAYSIVSELGEDSLAQFNDLNPDVNAFQRKFVNEVRRCEEMERKLRVLERELAKDKTYVPEPDENTAAPQPRELVDLELNLERLENELKDVNSNAETLKRNFLELTELKFILRKTQGWFEEQAASADHSQSQPNGGESMGLLHDLEDEFKLKSKGNDLAMGFFTGVINREKVPPFERMLWRTCRGNVFFRQSEIETALEDPRTGEEVHKVVFICFYQGEQLKSKVRKICEGFHAHLYPCPETPEERRNMAVGVMTRIEDLNTVLAQTQDHRRRVLVNAAKNLKQWIMKVKKVKAIYHIMNMFNIDVTQKCFIAEAWIAVDDIDLVERALKVGTDKCGGSVPSILHRIDSNESPPTFNRVNKFTNAFQHIIDAYGVANYQEANPAPFTIITFPFLFSVMFGDAGHAVIMFAFGFYMVIKEKKLGAIKSDNEIFNIFFGGRYLIMLMGLFAIYSGMIYNEIYSRATNIFGSSWTPHFALSTIETVPLIQLNPNSTAHDYTYSPYPFGMDPMWQLSKNKITFTNSFKMKISVIFGVSQMMFGIFLSFTNSIYFKNKINVWCEFIPEVIFLTAIFGYMNIMIFYKWVNFTPDDSGCAPSLLIGLIDMFLMKYPSPSSPCSEQMFYPGQKAFQMFLVFLTVMCVPWLLIPKPILLKIQHERNKKSRAPEVKGRMRNASETLELVANDANDVQKFDSSVEIGPFDDDNETKRKPKIDEFSMGDVLVHQGIHTIEFCLGCVSNTASYLRLWALSLAHSELTEVLWMMVMRIALKANGWVGAAMLLPIFAFWAVLTVCILLLMEGLSAFLHTLRLHWVEFQNKFYQGTGRKFQPFNFDFDAKLDEKVGK